MSYHIPKIIIDEIVLYKVLTWQQQMMPLFGCYVSFISDWSWLTHLHGFFLSHLGVGSYVSRNGLIGLRGWRQMKEWLQERKSQVRNQVNGKRQTFETTWWANLEYCNDWIKIIFMKIKNFFITSCLWLHSRREIEHFRSAW